MVRAAVFLCALLCVQAGTAEAGERRALIIGNADYRFQPLDNPVNDAELVGSNLQEVGFEVSIRRDLGLIELKRAVVEFARQLKKAGPDAVGLFYYAGHAVQADGENFLLPVDAAIRDSLDLRIQSLNLSTLMDSLDKAGNDLNIIMLDACRNNPLASEVRSAAGGLARVDTPGSTLVAYSTAPGAVAVDGDGEHSPYAEAFARALHLPNTPVEQVLKRVRVAVLEQTNGRQTPWESSSLTRDFFFNPSGPETSAALQGTSPPGAAQTATGGSSTPMAAEIDVWIKAETHGQASGYETYLALFPDGRFAALAKDRLAAGGAEDAKQGPSPEERAFFARVRALDRISAYDAYLKAYPEGGFIEIAEQRRRLLHGLEASNRMLQEAIGGGGAAEDPLHPFDGRWRLSAVATQPSKNVTHLLCRDSDAIDGVVDIKQGDLDGETGEFGGADAVRIEGRLTPSGDGRISYAFFDGYWNRTVRGEAAVTVQGGDEIRLRYRHDTAGCRGWLVLSRD